LQNRLPSSRHDCFSSAMTGASLLFSPGRWSAGELDELIHASSIIAAAGERIAFLSEKFLGTPYRESTLIGNETVPEALVVNLEGVDCFTFIDYIEAMRLSRSFREFTEKLRKVRYRWGEVAFSRRNHFFSDWTEFNRDRVEDVTEAIGGENAERTRKILNRKKDGTLFVGGVPTVERMVSHIPSQAVDRSMLGRLRTGDYLGVYSPVAGLDVSHVGVIISEGKTVLLRHASVKHRTVVDEDFAAYIAGTAGLMVLRPREDD
jgi:cell wall-associated NlpC family hydrolase